MRERLIELLKGAETKVTEMLSSPLALEEWLAVYADHLLANGVIVPPCEVGTMVYYADHENKKVFCGRICSFSLDAAHFWFNCHFDVGLNYWYQIEELGKTVFLTRVEAEQALEDMRKE